MTQPPKAEASTPNPKKKKVHDLRVGALALNEDDPRYKSDVQKSGPFYYLHFGFLFKMIRKSNILAKMGKSLDEKMLISFKYTDRAEVIEARLKNYLVAQKKRNKGKGPKLNLISAILWDLRWKLLITSTVELFWLFTRVFSSWICKNFIDTLLDLSLPISDAYQWAGLLSINLVGALYLEHHYYYLKTLYPLHIRAALISFIYSKISGLSIYSMNKISLGRLVNIVANDVNLLERSGQYLQNLFSGPIGLLGGTVLLWSWFGPACLIGVGYALFGFPIQQFIARISMKPRSQQNKANDERVKVTSEVFEGVRLLKMYTWEIIFRDRIYDVREKEVKQLTKIHNLESVSRGIAYSTQVVASFLIFMLYSVTGGTLSISTVFPGFYLIGCLRLYSVFFFAMGLTFITEAKLLMKRISDILETPDMGSIQFPEPKNPENSIEFNMFSAFWSREDAEIGSNMISINVKTFAAEKENLASLASYEPKATIMDVSLDLKQGSLNAIIGKVGSGKSSLLLSFTGEMPLTTGDLRYKGSITYVEQEPTIFAGTIRDNILFGKPYKPELYKKVIQTCNLQNDLRLFSNLDMSEVGERGVNLSGGQKARLALARAVYSEADIYLLDDPLSAVDAKVAKSLFRDVICGVLKGKTVLLATHQVHFIKELESIIVIDDGKIVANGSYEQIKQQYTHVDALFNIGTKNSQAEESKEELNFTEVLCKNR